MKLNDWVKLAGADDGNRGQVIMFGRNKADDLAPSWVFVHWLKGGNKCHEPEELEVIEEKQRV